MVWRLVHGNGQTAACAILPAGGRYRVQRLLNDFIAGTEEFPNKDAARKHAADVRRDLERRGFYEDL